MNRRSVLFLGLTAAITAGAALSACGGGGDTPAPSPTPPSPSAGPLALDVSAPASPVSSGVAARLVTFASGLTSPWSMAFLPDRRLLVTQKDGRLVVVSADGQTTSAPLTGVPAVDARDQGGLLDVALDPQFETNRLVYLAYSELVSGANGTAVARGTLNASATGLDNVVVIFRQSPKKTGTTGHYGSRLVFRGDGTLFVTLGERQAYSSEAQLLTSQLGKVVRIQSDGALPADNPYAAQGGTAAAVWSLGHRNPQAAALHPTTGELWVAEHGPQGGDEVNLALAGRNFGWPNVSYGCNYGEPVGTTCRLGGGTHVAPYTEPLAYWYPTSTAPGGMAFYTGTRFPEWQGSLFVGGLAGRTLWRFVLNGNAIVGQEPFFAGQHEIRDVRQGPDGWIYLISRNAGQILRVER
jgi:glucose/arabinose dehydrogenase